MGGLAGPIVLLRGRVSRKSVVVRALLYCWNLLVKNQVGRDSRIALNHNCMQELG